MNIRRLPTHRTQQLLFVPFSRQVVDLNLRAVRRETTNDPGTTDREPRIDRTDDLRQEPAGDVAAG